MLLANKLMPQGRGLAPVLLKRAATVALDWSVRQKDCFDSIDSEGRALSVSLPKGTVLHSGDVLVVEDGALARVLAAHQPVLRITICPTHGTPFDLTRAAFHLAHLQVPVELAPTHLKIEPDQALADMLRSMHLTVNETEETFEPEESTSANAGGHDHGRKHPENHRLASTTLRTPTPISAVAEPHVHGPDCAHGHSDGHSHERSHSH